MTRHACGHLSRDPARDAARPCRTCRRRVRIDAAIRNRAAGLPDLDAAQGTPDQILLAEEIRDRWHQAGGDEAPIPTCAESVEPRWWIGRHRSLVT